MQLFTKQENFRHFLIESIAIDESNVHLKGYKRLWEKWEKYYYQHNYTLKPFLEDLYRSKLVSPSHLPICPSVCNIFASMLHLNIYLTSFVHNFTDRLDIII